MRFQNLSKFCDKKMNKSLLEKTAGTLLCNILLEMCVQSLKLIVLVVFILELVICSPVKKRFLVEIPLTMKTTTPNTL